VQADKLQDDSSKLRMFLGLLKKYDTMSVSYCLAIHALQSCHGRRKTGSVVEEHRLKHNTTGSSV